MVETADQLATATLNGRLLSFSHGVLIHALRGWHVALYEVPSGAQPRMESRRGSRAPADSPPRSRARRRAAQALPASVVPRCRTDQSLLASLAWRLLTSGQDYAYANPSRVRLKLRRIELLAGEPRRRGRQLSATQGRERERELALAAERAYQRLVADRQAGGNAKKGAGAAVGRASRKAHVGPGSAADPKEPQRSAL
jgi:hypothetical protein